MDREPGRADVVSPARGGQPAAGAARQRRDVPLDRPDDLVGAAALSGDEDAFAALVEPHRDVSFRLACVITGSAAEAEDAVQDALVKAWRALGRYRTSDPFRPWLLRIVANEARNRRRASGRRLRLTLRAAAEPAPAPDPAARQELLDALHELPDDAQAVLVCRDLLGLSEQETAAALDIAQGTVKSRTARALERLRELYG